MLLQLSYNTFIRFYDDIGYIVNYNTGEDRTCNESGCVFLKVLNRTPKKFDTMLEEACNYFEDVTCDDIREYALEFYNQLIEDKFLISGKTVEEIKQKDIESRFSYQEIFPSTLKMDFTPIIPRADENTQMKLWDHFSEKSHLMQFQIELTSKCNERCVHCYIPHENKNLDIEDDLFYSVIKQCSEMNVLGIALSGGEPMTHPNFLKYLRELKKYDFSISILSNLTLLTDSIIEELKQLRISSIQVSLYSLNPEIHDSITQVNGSFEKTFANIKRLIKENIPLQLSCPAMKINKDSVIDVLEWGQKNKVKTTIDYNLIAEYDRNTENLNHRLDVTEVKKLINEIIIHDKNYQKLLKSSDYLEKRGTYYDWDPNAVICGVGISSACMVANGNVYPCAGWQSYICGNLYNHKLEDIWSSSKEMNYLRSIRKKDFPKCKNCDSQKFCSICMVRNANEDIDGNPLNINEHFCDIAKINKEIVLDWIEGNLK